MFAVVRSRFDHLEPERQDEIIRAAADEFGEKGYDSASINRIIAKAGVSKGSLYYYFEDKGDLFSTVMERATTAMVRLVGGMDLAALTRDTFWPSFEAIVRRSAQRLSGNAWYTRLARAFYRYWGRTGDRGPAGKFFAWIRKWTEDVLRRGQALGAVRTDLPLPLLVDLTMALGQVSDQWMLEAWDDFAPDERERVVELQMGLFRRLLEPHGEGDTP